jgi:tetratricopeptide (TPR) repeat protein
MSSSVRTSLVFVCCLLVSFLVFAQEHSDYELIGKVTDSKGNPIAGAKITLKETESGKQISFKTKDDGTYDQLFIPHAVYHTTIEKEGYEPRTATLDLSLLAPTTIKKEMDVVLITAEEEAEIKRQQEQAKADQQIQADYKKGVAAFDAKNYDQAISIMQDLTKRSPQSYGPYLVLAACYHIKGDCDKAVEFYQKAVALKGDLADAYRGMGDCDTSKKQYEQAVENYKKYLELQPQDVETRCVMANVMYALDKLDQAEPQLAQAMQENPNIAVCHKTNAEILLRKGDMKGSAAEFRKYLELQPDAPDKAQINDMIKAIEQSQ